MDKTSKFFLWFGIGIILIIVFVIIRVNMVEADEKETRTDRSIGKYKLELGESKLGEYISDSLSLMSLELTLSQDSTFYFSKNVPFLFDSCGKWTVKEVGIYGYNQLIYKKNSEFKNQISPCCYNGDRIQMKMPISQEGYNQVELLVFRKVN